jgi:putative peptidoglycan lipid II flippase
LYARAAPAAAAGATVLGWLAVAGGSLGLAAVWPPEARVSALAWGNSVGMTVLGAALVVMAGTRLGTSTLRGAVRSGCAGILAGAVGAVVALGVRPFVLPHTQAVGVAFARGMLCGVVLVAVFLGVAYGIDRATVGPAVAAFARRIGTRRTDPATQREEAVP